MRPKGNELTVCFWNILFDVYQPSLVKSQSDRLPDIIKELRRFPKNSIIGLAEVEGDNGQLIAEGLDSQTEYFVEYDRPNDYIGVVSQLKLSPRFIQIDEKCRVVVAKHGEVTIVIVHMTLAILGEALRKQQIRTLLSNLDTAGPMVIMGDFNSMAWQRSRKLLVKAGFRSALGRSIVKRLPTVPARKYRHMYPQPYKALGRYGFTLDDIYVREVQVSESGIFEGESDHLGVWAKLHLDM